LWKLGRQRNLFGFAVSRNECEQIEN
jgi:hypothetical protein